MTASFAPLTFPKYRALVGGAETFAYGLSEGERPVGLALAAGNELLSLFLEPELRGRGLACRLLAGLEGAARGRGVDHLHGTYATRRSTTAALERALARAGWAPPSTEMLCFLSGPAQVADAPWMRPLRPGERDRIVSFTELPAGQLDALAAEAPAWIPPDLQPWSQEAGWDPETSVALLRDGALLGWLLTHRLGPGTLRFTCSYVHPALQKRGRVLVLYQEVVARMKALGLPTAIWTVPLRHEGMRAFGERWMAPYADSVWELRASSKSLG